MLSIPLTGERLTVFLFVASLTACSSSGVDGAGGSTGSTGTGGSGGNGMAPAGQDNHCVIKVSGAAFSAATYQVTGPIKSVYPKGVDATYTPTTDLSGFYCQSAAPIAYSAEVQANLMGQLDQMIPYVANETTGNYLNVGITYSHNSTTDETKRQWWSCHAGMDSISGSVAKGTVGQFSISFNAAAPQMYVGGKPTDFVLGGTIHAVCPPFTPAPAAGVPGSETMTMDVTFD